MMNSPRWEYCVNHKGETEVTNFFKSYLLNNNKKVLLIAGAGFDPRACYFATLLHDHLDGRLTTLLLKEERPNPSSILNEKAADNTVTLEKFLVNLEVIPVDIFSSDLAVVGGINAVKLVTPYYFKEFDDIIFDQSALSIGVSFPLIRTALQLVDNKRIKSNLHIVVVANSDVDKEIESTQADNAREIHGFKGKSGLYDSKSAAILWLPQLAFNESEALDKLHTDIHPHDVCPILPFPSTDLRSSDDILNYITINKLEFWKVDPSNLIYAAEDNPLDLYYTILRIDDERKDVFMETGGSLIVLSPTGSKILAIGALMAAVDRDLAMRYIEAIEYKVNWTNMPQHIVNKEKIMHIWLAGTAYNNA